MNINTAINITRNPYSHSEDKQSKAVKEKLKNESIS
jgi:hypothetical protein